MHFTKGYTHFSVEWDARRLCTELRAFFLRGGQGPSTLRGTTCVSLTWSVRFVFPSHLLSSPFFLVPPSRNWDPGSQSRLFPPLPTTVRALNLYREDSPALSSLVDSCRIAPTHARRSRQLVSYFCMERESTIG